MDWFIHTHATVLLTINIFLIESLKYHILLFMLTASSDSSIGKQQRFTKLTLELWSLSVAGLNTQLPTLVLTLVIVKRFKNFSYFNREFRRTNFKRACTIAGNYYTDLCLFAAWVQALGTLDFYQVHTYAPYGSYAPFKVIQLFSIFTLFFINKEIKLLI